MNGYEFPLMPIRFSSDPARSTQAAEISRQVEEFLVSDEAETLCRRLLAGEITFEQYLTLVLSKSGCGRSIHTQE